MNIRKFLNQDAIYWAPKSLDEYGNMRHDFAVDMKVRLVMKSNVRSTPVSDIVSPNATILCSDQVEPLGALALGSIYDLADDGTVVVDSAVVIRTVLPFVDRRGNILGYEITTDAQFTLGRG